MYFGYWLMHGFLCVFTCLHSYCVFQASLQEELATMQILLSEATDDSQVSGMFMVYDHCSQYCWCSCTVSTE